MYKKLSVLLNVNITVSTIKQIFNQGGRKVSIKWCNHLDKKKSHFRWIEQMWQQQNELLLQGKKG